MLKHLYSHCLSFIILLSLSVFPKFVSVGVYSKLTHSGEILVANWDHASPSELATNMGVRAPGIPMPITCTVDAVLQVSVLIPLVICPLEAFNGLINKGELDQPSTHVVKWGCLVERSSRHTTCVIGAAWFRDGVLDL